MYLLLRKGPGEISPQGKVLVLVSKFCHLCAFDRKKKSKERAF